MYLDIEFELELKGRDCPDLRVTSLQGREQVGAPYRFIVRVVQRARKAGGGIQSLPPLTEADVVSATSTIRILERREGRDELVRTVRGVVQSFEEGMDEEADGGYVYEFVIEPRLAELGRFVSQDLYSGLTYPEVIRAKLTAAQFTDGQDFAIRLSDPTVYGPSSWTDGDPDTAVAQPRLVVQYKESDLAFVSRVAEHVGISYFFEDAGDHERLVFTDYADGYATHDGNVAYRGDSTVHGILGLRRRTLAVKSDFYVYDYSYRTPNAAYEVAGERLFDVIGGEAHLDVPSAGAHMEYAPNAKTAAEAALLARVRADQEEGDRERYLASGPLPRLYPGVRFHLDNHTKVDSAVELLVVRARTTFEAPAAFLQSEGGGVTPRYNVELEVVRATKTGPGGRIIPFRSGRITPRPRINGVVTGVVQSTSHDLVSNHQHLDAQGRYFVRLHFDQTTRSMPRIRMAQPHSGEGYGHHFPLRPGAEVLVAFVDGDPDRPVIVGTVPNPVKASPVVAPKQNEDVELSRIQSRSGIKIEFSDGPKGS